jgi:Recombinase
MTTSNEKPGTIPFGTTPAEKAIVAIMMELHASGPALNKIGIEPDKAGIPTRGGGQWRSSTISKVLRRHGVGTT